MKKIILVFISLMFIMCLVACGEKNKCTVNFFSDGKSDIKISEDMQEKIKSKYVSEYLLKYNENASIDEVHIDKFYGVYNNAYVLIMSNDYVEYRTAITYEVILTYRFQYSNSNKIKVFYEDSFYSLTSAYLNKILSDEDIREIYKKFIK